MASKDYKSVLELIEEDDSYEEFDSTWFIADSSIKEDEQLWQDNWDDDTTEDQFTNQLREAVTNQNVNAASVTSKATQNKQ